MTIAPLALACACAAASLALARRAAALTFGAGARQAAAERRAALARASEACFKAALLVCFVTLPAVSTTIFRTLHCDDGFAHGERFLHADLSIDCNSARHRKFKVRKRHRPEACHLPSRRLTPALPHSAARTHPRARSESAEGVRHHPALYLPCLPAALPRVPAVARARAHRPAVGDDGARGHHRARGRSLARQPPRLVCALQGARSARAERQRAAPAPVVPPLTPFAYPFAPDQQKTRARLRRRQPKYYLFEVSAVGAPSTLARG